MPKSIYNSLYRSFIYILIFTIANSSFLNSTSTTDNFKDQQDLDNTIESVLQYIDVDSVSAVINHLQSYDSRFMLAPNRFEVSEWIHNEFLKMGFTNVGYDSFEAATNIHLFDINTDTITTQRNVIATIEGSVDPDQQIIVCGHYDSFNNVTDPLSQAPGADDNASGTAAVLEIARAFQLSGFIPKKTIKFIAFAAEELLYFGDAGSEHYAEMAYNNDDNIILVINHDMISHTFQSLENSTVNINRHPESDIYSSLGLVCIEKFSEIQGEPEDFWSSDLLPFHELGFKGIYFEESEFSPFYHTPDDIQDNYNMEFCSEVIKASAATLANMALLPNQVSNLNIVDQQQENNVLVKWSPATESDISHYKLHVTDETAGFDELYTPVDTFQIVSGLTLNKYYNFELAAVDFDGLEGLANNQEFIPVSFTQDAGILIVDETLDGNGSLLNPTDEQVDLFYNDLANKFNISEIDIAQEGIRLGDIVEYSTIIWHGNGNFESIQNFTPELQRFLNAGGNFIYAGEKPTMAFSGNATYPDSFYQGQFIYDYLKIQSTEKKFGTRFNGGISAIPGYPDIYSDTLKTKAVSNYHLKNIESIFPTTDAQVLYKYSCAYDSTSIQGAMIGQPVGILYEGAYKSVVLSFPLYYMEYDKTQILLEKILSEKFGEITNISEQKLIKPASFALQQNFPNPFNSTTQIKFTVAKAAKVLVDIFNIQGKRLKVLVNESKSAGDYQIEWNGTDSYNKSVSSGVYFYRINTGHSSITKKMILIK